MKYIVHHLFCTKQQSINQSINQQSVRQPVVQ